MVAKQETKKWYKSATLWGILISVVGKLVASYFGLTIAETDLQDASNAVLAVVNADTLTAAIALATSFVGDGVAAFGRIKATKVIGK